MSEVGEIYKAVKEIRREKKALNVAGSLNYLEHKQIEHKVMNECTWHVLVCGNIDFWPTTGKWKVRGKKKEGRGVFSLVRYITT